MALFVETEDPCFIEDLEPQELRCNNCHFCRQSADQRCYSCRVSFCERCQSAHHSSSAECDVNAILCEQCLTKEVEFYCRTCVRYVCSTCWSVHWQNELTDHEYFCVDGPKSVLLWVASWNKEFTTMVKVSRQQLLARLDPLEQRDGVCVKPEPMGADRSRREAMEIDNQFTTSHQLPQYGRRPMTTTTAGSAVEPPHGSATPSRSDGPSGPVELGSSMSMPTSSIAPTSPPPTSAAPPTSNGASNQDASDTSNVSIKMEPTRVAAAAATTRKTRGQNQFQIVDLTEDDPTPDSSENTSPTAATTAFSSSSAHSMDALSNSFHQQIDLLLNEDLFSSSMISKYNYANQQVATMEQRIHDAGERMQQLLTSNNMTDMAQAMQVQSQIQCQKRDMQQQVESRNDIVANLMMYWSQQDPEFRDKLHKILDACASSGDIPFAEAASHRHCAQLGATIAAKRELVQTSKKQMEETIQLKTKDCLAEVRRLGSVIAEEESAIGQLETQRIDKFLHFCEYSRAIRAKTLQLVGSSQP